MFFFNSMPTDADATPEASDQSASTASSATGPVISPIATATPSADAPRELAICGGGLDLGAASDLVRQEVSRRRDADGEPFAAKAVVSDRDGRSAAIAGAAVAGRHLGEHRGMRTQALRP